MLDRELLDVENAQAQSCATSGRSERTVSSRP
jgi:hypothetical protein